MPQVSWVPRSGFPNGFPILTQFQNHYFYHGLSHDSPNSPWMLCYVPVIYLKKYLSTNSAWKNGFPWFCFSLFPNFGCWKLILYWLTPSKTRCSWCDPIFGRLKIIFFWCVYPTIMRLENSQVVAPIGSLAALAQLTTPNPFTIDKPIHNWILGRSSQDHPTYIYTYIYTWNPNDPSFGWLTFNFTGQNLENKGHSGSRYIKYVYKGY